MLVAVAALALMGIFLLRSRLDVVSLLTLYFVALFGINARLVLPGAGAVATPAMVIAIVGAWWWWLARTNPTWGTDTDPNAVRVMLLLYLWFNALSWGLSGLRRLSELEVNGSLRAVITTVALTGIALLITDGIRSLEEMETLLRRVVMAGAAFSVVGILQFVASIDLVAAIRIPGLVVNNDAVQSLATRGAFRRAEGTALHSIEFTVVLAMILPLAIYFVMRSPLERRRRHEWMAAIVAAGIPLSISRSGILAVVVALIVTSIAWSWRERLVGMAVSGGALVVMGVAVPGLLGTLQAVVFGSSNDPSITARIDRIPRVVEQVSEAVWFGSGIGTWSSDEDFLLDNQYFGILIETGVLGLLVVIGLIAASSYACYSVLQRSGSADARYLAAAILAGIAVFTVSLAVFDAFFYRILMGVSFLMFGTAGALWRLYCREEVRTPNTV